MAKTADERLRRKVIQQTAKIVVRRLKTKRACRLLFPAVAKALGCEWMPGTRKSVGYALMMDYAAREGIVSGAFTPKLARPASEPRVASDDFLFSAAWRRLRMRVLVARGARCECCGASPKDGVTVLNVDHIKPRKLFPALALVESNLQVLCAACNHGKGNWDQTDWRPGSDTIQ